MKRHHLTPWLPACVVALFLVLGCDPNTDISLDKAQQTAVAAGISAMDTRVAEAKVTAAAAAESAKKTIASGAKEAETAVNDSLFPAKPEMLFESLPIPSPNWTNGFGATTYARDNWKTWYQNTSGIHGGIDEGCSPNSKPVAGVRGKLEGTSGDARPNVVVKTGQWYVTFGHVDQDPSLRPGADILPSTVIGTVHSQGTNTHVHISVRRCDHCRFYNPLLFFPPSVASAYNWGPYVEGEGVLSIHSFLPVSTDIVDYWSSPENPVLGIQR